MTAFYSEFDPKAAAWLRELIKRGHIADGIVDERDLWDLSPADLRGFAQVHLCAGIGVWSYALRNAGWPDDRPVWTASFPCQPFSAAGKGKGFADERHLWPAGHFLIEECRPEIIFGEQVASKDGLTWFDLVQADLEGSGYACGAVDLCAAGFGAPHIRQRLYWTAERLADERRAEPSGRGAASGCGDGGVGDTSGQSGQWDAGSVSGAQTAGGGSGRADGHDDHGYPDAGAIGGLADAAEPGREPRGRATDEGDGRGASRFELGRLRDAERVADAAGARYPEAGQHERGPSQLSSRSAEHGGVVRPAGPTNGLWRDADWLFCRDGKWRPVEARAQQMVDGPASGVGRSGDLSPEQSAQSEIGFPLGRDSEARVARLRGYGNAIVAPVAQTFIEAYLST